MLFIVSRAMDPLDILPVRFHLGGHFDFDGQLLHYIGGRVEFSHIERQNVTARTERTLG